MVNLNMPFVMLKQQRRMKPELRYILKPFYPELYDHPSVESINHRPDVLGMGGRNSWLFDHTWPEGVNSDFSKFNEQEAEMITNFFAYLVANGTPAEKITVLTFYKGQRKVLLKKLKSHPAIIGSTFNVCTVDSYQGEENDIILLSLVRSPQLNRAYAVGFLEDERRAVVAISRARRGFYIFGNVDNVLSAHQASHDLWFKICSGFAEQERIHSERGLPLVCQRHNREIWLKEVEDWRDNSGGCDLPCKQTRDCGHPCTLKCHALPHDALACSEPCHEKLDCGHGCSKLCGQRCFCDCKRFEELTRPTQNAGQPMSLMDKMKLMAAEETEMFKLHNRSASLQQAQSIPKLPVPGQLGVLKGSRNGTHGQPPRKTTPVPATQTRTRWERHIESIERENRLLTQQSFLTTSQQGHEMVIDDVYKPTTVEIGQEVATQKLPVLQLLPALQPFVSQRNPTQLPESHLDLLSDPIPLETSAFGKTYSIAHDQALTPFPSIPVAEDLVPLSGAINSYPAHAPPTCTQVQAQAQGQGQSRNQIQTVRQEDGGTQIEDGEEWLIQL